jgi:hypothetical protein
MGKWQESQDDLTPAAWRAFKADLAGSLGDAPPAAAGEWQRLASRLGRRPQGFDRFAWWPAVVCIAAALACVIGSWLLAPQAATRAAWMETAAGAHPLQVDDDLYREYDPSLDGLAMLVESSGSL